MALTSANQGLTRLSRGEIHSNSFCHHQQLNQTQLNPETSVFSTEATRSGALGGGSYLPRPSRLTAQTSLGWGKQSVKAVSVNLAGRLLITLLRASRSAQLLLLRREASREL